VLISFVTSINSALLQSMASQVGEEAYAKCIIATAWFKVCEPIPFESQSQLEEVLYDTGTTVENLRGLVLTNHRIRGRGL
jgi:hypothetical protein